MPSFTFVVTKLDRLARSLPDARDILAELTAKNVGSDPSQSVRTGSGGSGVAGVGDSCSESEEDELDSVS